MKSPHVQECVNMAKSVCVRERESLGIMMLSVSDKENVILISKYKYYFSETVNHICKYKPHISDLLEKKISYCIVLQKLLFFLY